MVELTGAGSSVSDLCSNWPLVRKQRSGITDRLKVSVCLNPVHTYSCIRQIQDISKLSVCSLFSSMTPAEVHFYDFRLHSTPPCCFGLSTILFAYGDQSQGCFGHFSILLSQIMADPSPSSCGEQNMKYILFCLVSFSSLLSVFFCGQKIHIVFVEGIWCGRLSAY